MPLKLLFASLFLLGFARSLAQNTAGLIMLPDTSYTNAAALKQVRAEFPEVQLAVSTNREEVQQVKNINYCADSLKGDLYIPKQKHNGVALLFIHGGGWRTGDKTQHAELAIELASRGYIVFTPSYRLSTHALYPSAVADLKAALYWLHLKYPAYKIAVGGFSAGGQLAAFLGVSSAISFKDYSLCPTATVPIAAVIDIDGILAFIHPESGEGNDAKGISAATHYFGYTKEENPDLWKSAGALEHVSAQAPPFLFINSREARMHAGREDFIAILNSHNIYSEVHTFPDAPHSFPQMDKWFLKTVNIMDSFLHLVEFK